MAPATARDAKPGSRWRSPFRSILFGARNSASHVRNIGRQVAPETIASQITTILVSVTSATVKTIAPTSTSDLAKGTLETDSQLAVEPSKTIDTGSHALKATTEGPSLALPFKSAALSPVTTTITETTDLPGELFLSTYSTDSQSDSVSTATATDTELNPASKPDTGIVGGLVPLKAFTVTATSSPAGITGLPEQTSFRIDDQSTVTTTAPGTGVILHLKNIFISPTGITSTTIDGTADSSHNGAIPIETRTTKTIIPSDPSDVLDAPPATTKLSLPDGSDLNQSTIALVEPTVAPFTGSDNILLNNTPIPAEETSTSSASEDPSFPQSSGPIIDSRPLGVPAGGSTPTSAPTSVPAASSDGTLPKPPGDPSDSLSPTDPAPASGTGAILSTSLVKTETTISSPTASPNTPGSNNADAASPKSSNKGTIIAAVVGVMVALVFGLVMILIARRLRRTQFVKNMSTPFTQAPKKRTPVMSQTGLIRRTPNWMFESPPQTPHPSRTRSQSRRNTWHTRRTSTSSIGSGFDDAIQAIPVG